MAMFDSLRLRPHWNARRNVHARLDGRASYCILGWVYDLDVLDVSNSKHVWTLVVFVAVIALGSLATGIALSQHYSQPTPNLVNTISSQYFMMNQYPQQLSTQTAYTQAPYSTALTIDQAKTIAQQYLARTGNPDLAVKEIMEFQYNYYIIYYEKSTGRGAFEMLIWKQTPPGGMMGGGMMGGYGAPGLMVPEPGPNMMWNIKYSPMANGIMGYRNQASSTISISRDQAQQLAQEYLNSHFSDAKTEMATEFYGYYTFDFTVGGNVAGMLSVNGYTGSVWYHSWHGAYIQEIEFS